MKITKQISYTREGGIIIILNKQKTDKTHKKKFPRGICSVVFVIYKIYAGIIADFDSALHKIVKIQQENIKKFSTHAI